MRKLLWRLKNPWEVVVGIDLWLVEDYPTPRWKRRLSNLMLPLTRIAVNRWHPETLETQSGWSPRPWNKRSW